MVVPPMWSTRSASAFGSLHSRSECSTYPNRAQRRYTIMDVPPCRGSAMTSIPIPQTGAEVRRLSRLGAWTTHTAGVAPGFVQANLVIVPRQLAYDFLLFCQRNPKPCPLLDV